MSRPAPCRSYEPTAVNSGATLPAASASRPVPAALELIGSGDETARNGRGAGLNPGYLFGGARRPYGMVSDMERDLWEPRRSVRR